MNTQEKLKNLYSSKWLEITSKLQAIQDTDIPYEDKPSNPLLLFIKDNNDWERAEIRLMIFGQETNTWYDSFNPDINYSISNYNNFFNKERFNYGKPFWNGVNLFTRLLKDKHPNKSIHLLWNNLIKIGKNSVNTPSEEIYQSERQSFDVIKSEIEILRPNLILFLSGPNYDRVISDIFGEIKYQQVEDFTQRQLARIDIPEVNNSFRTYHPGYLYRIGIEDYFKKIIDEIKL